MAEKRNEILLSAPRVELWGQQLALVEGFKSIVRFERDVIELKCRKYNILLHGFDMEIAEISKGAIEIRGTIVSLDMRREDSDV